MKTVSILIMFAMCAVADAQLPMNTNGLTFDAKLVSNGGRSSPPKSATQEGALV